MQTWQREKQKELTFVFLGPQNSGKSTLVNLLVNFPVILEGRLNPVERIVDIRFGPETRLFQLLPNGERGKEISPPMNLTDSLELASWIQEITGSSTASNVLLECPSVILETGIRVIYTPREKALSEREWMEYFDLLPQTCHFFLVGNSTAAFNLNLLKRVQEIWERKKWRTLTLDFGMTKLDEIDDNEIDEAKEKREEDQIRETLKKMNILEEPQGSETMKSSAYAFYHFRNISLEPVISKMCRQKSSPTSEPPSSRSS